MLDGLVPGRGQAQCAGRQVALGDLTPVRLGRQAIDPEELQGRALPFGSQRAALGLPLAGPVGQPGRIERGKRLGEPVGQCRAGKAVPEQRVEGFLQVGGGGPFLARDEQPRQHDPVDQGQLARWVHELAPSG